MINQDRLAEASRHILDTDMRILQGYRLGMTDREHIENLLEYMNPAIGSTWLDVGCGFGEPARMMAEIRPDLEFCLVNNNRFQLENVPPGMDARFADMHNMPFADQTFDGVMYLFSLCHADSMLDTLKEAARLTRLGGKLFVFDYLRKAGNNSLTTEHLSASFHSLGEIMHICRDTGWAFDDIHRPHGSDALFRAVFEKQQLYDRIFDDLCPVVWWAYRK